MTNPDHPHLIQAVKFECVHLGWAPRWRPCGGVHPTTWRLWWEFDRPTTEIPESGKLAHQPSVDAITEWVEDLVNTMYPYQTTIADSFIFDTENEQLLQLTAKYVFEDWGHEFPGLQAVIVEQECGWVRAWPHSETATAWNNERLTAKNEAKAAEYADFQRYLAKNL